MPLFLDGSGPRVQWSRGSAELLLEHHEDEHTLPFAIRCRFGSLPPAIAMLDTGAQHTVLASDTAERLKSELLAAGEEMTMTTRLGKFRGVLHRIPILLVADDGYDLQVEATCVVLVDWTGPNIVGYRGFADRLRIALDPGFTPSDQPTWYFGAPLD